VPGDPDSSVVLAIYTAIADPGAAAEARRRLLAGAGDGELEGLLLDLLEDRFGAARDRYRRLVAEPGEVDAVLAAGRERARETAAGVLARVKRGVGLGNDRRVRAPR
jgi:tryptophanyl-tRNA synthetase